MRSTTATINRRIRLPGRKPRFFDKMARATVLARLEKLQAGALHVVERGASRTFGRITEQEPLTVTVEVLDERVYREVAFGGSIGVGEAYMKGYWVADDLTAFIRLWLRNREVMDNMETGLVRLTAPLQQFMHGLRRNTRAGSRRNIARHYDIGNDFFELMLDPTMTYSCALFERPRASLEEASTAKLDHICRKLALSPRDHVLEIGCGWGSFAIHAAALYGCKVTATTISKAQHALARERIDRAGLADRITLLLRDYRELEGRYDKLVSIEMIEAVGHQYYDRFFGKCAKLLKPDGLMALQAITIADRYYEAARRSVDFIQRYIFPGSTLPSLAAMTASMARATDFRLAHLEDIGAHYAKTLRRWRENLFARLERVRALGYSDEFIRMWEFYLCYCEGGFLEGTISDTQMIFAKPGNRYGVPLAGTCCSHAGGIS